MRENYNESAQGLCFGDDVCPLIPVLTPRNVVYRNIGTDGLCTPIHAQYQPDTVRSVTFVLPVDFRLCISDNSNLYMDVLEACSKPNKIRIVFDHDEDPSKYITRHTATGTQLEPCFAELRKLLSMFISHSNKKYQIYGIERMSALFHGYPGMNTGLTLAESMHLRLMVPMKKATKGKCDDAVIVFKSWDEYQEDDSAE